MRYDGYEIKRYLPREKDSTSICSEGIYSVFEDSHQQLWIGTDKGLNKYNEESDDFVSYQFKQPSKGNLSVNFINKIVESPDSTLWILTQNGMFSYRQSTNEFRYHYNIKSNDNNFTCIDWDDDGRVWCGTNNVNGLYLFNPKDDSYVFFPDNVHPQNRVGNKTLLIDSDNTFWYGHRGVGLAKFTPGNSRFDYYPAKRSNKGTNGNFIYDIVEVDSVNLFVGIDQGGISVLDRKSNDFFHITNDDFRYGNIGSNGVFCIHLDYEGIIWVGTSRGGVSYSNPKEARFDTYKPMYLAQIRKNQQSYYPSYGFNSCFLEDSEGIIWIGTDGGGVNLFNRKTRKFQVLNKLLDPDLKVIRSICQDSDENIWFTPWEGEIVKYLPKERKYSREVFESPQLVELSANARMDMLIDNKDRFWLAYTFGEVACYNKNKELIGQYYIGDSIRYMDPELYESEGGIIYAVSKSGIFKYEEQEDRMLRIVSADNVASLDFGSDDDIWFGTLFGDVYHCSMTGQNVKEHKVLKSEHKLRIKAVAFVSNQLWISTDGGIVIYDIRSQTTDSFDKYDGLQGNEFFMQSVLKAKDGQVFFGGDNGFSAFYPEKMFSNNFVPPVYITDLFISSGKQSMADSIVSIKNTEILTQVELEWKPKLMLDFHFVAINLTFPGKSQYKYMLEGFDSSWNKTSAVSRNALYTNLNPGEYIFRVKASNNDGVWNEEGATLRVIINPPFWKTAWFVVLVILIMIVWMYLYVLYRERKIQRDKNLLKEKVAQRTKLIEEQKEKLDKQNQLLEEQFEELEAKQEELQVQNEELNHHRNNLQELVDEQTADLIRAKEKAEESERLKSSFLANMSHEIRTPMNAIIGFSSLLIAPEVSEEEKKAFVPMIRDNSEVLLHLVEDILDFSMIESNQMKINYREFNLNDLIENVFASFILNNIHNMVDMRLKNTVENEELFIYSDEYRVRQILTNLMSNAMKFTAKGFVELGARKRNELLELYVKDTGVGMSAKEQAVIFKQFVKLQKDQYSNIRGIGLGLSISKSLAKMLNGDLYVISQKDKGSEFVLTLPIE